MPTNHLERRKCRPEGDPEAVAGRLGHVRTEQNDVCATREEAAAPRSSELPVREAESSAAVTSKADAGGPLPPWRTLPRRRRRPVVLGLAALGVGLAAYAALDDGARPPAPDQSDEQTEIGQQAAADRQVAVDGEEGEEEVVGDPFEGRSLYVDPDNPAARQAEEWRTTRPSDAATMDRIGGSPAAQWFGRGSGQVRSDVDKYVSAADDAGALPVLVAYNIPERDCGQFSGGGAETPGAYRNWITEFGRGIGDRAAVVILEPDALAHLSCLSEADQLTRVALLSEAIGVLEERPGVSVYVDAGNPGWIPADQMTDLLVSVGVDRARGFALNVSSYHSTESAVGYAKELSDRLGGKGAVIDTSRNGAGSDGEWCNAIGRALGPAPTADTADPAVDAYLWVKTPGESDGECNGGPSAGAWWPEYVLDLAARASY